MRQEALDTVYELAKIDPRVVFVGSDLGKGVLDKFKKEMPDRFIMEGISEAHIIGMCAGLAMEGKIPYMNTIATFISRRAYEQVVLDVCLHNLPVRMISNGGGVVYAPLGPTHLAIEDMAILRTVPNMTIIAPADPQEMIALMKLTLDYKGPVYVRVAKGGEPIVTPKDHSYALGKAVPIKTGKDALIVTTGVTLAMALEAAQQVTAAGLDVAIVHFPTVKPLDVATLLQAAKGKQAVVSIEEGVVAGGFGSAVGEALLEAGAAMNLHFHRIGIGDKFPEKYGSQASLMTHCGISTEQLVSSLKELCKPS